MKNTRPQPPENPRGRNPRNKELSDNEKVFQALYGKEEDFREDQIAKFSPRYAGYLGDPLKSTTNLPQAPSPIDLSATSQFVEFQPTIKVAKSTANLPTTNFANYLKKSQQNIPQITIPKRSFGKGAISARPHVLEPLVPQEHIQMNTPHAANDNLALFDEADFDAPDFDKQIQNQLKNGPIPAHSMYMTNDGNCSWLPCTVISVSGNNYTIRWNSNGKTKVVHRLSVRLDNEDQERFQQRRDAAVAHREETVQNIKQQTYLQMKTEEETVTQDPKMMEDIIRMLPKKMRISRHLTGLIQEINHLYSYAHTIVDFRLQWNDPEKAEEFKKEGIIPIENTLTVLAGMTRLDPSRIKALKLANCQMLVAANGELIDFLSDDFLTHVAKGIITTTSFGYFFESLKDAILAKRRHASDILVSNLDQYLTKMIVENEGMRKLWVKMMNLRFNNTLATLVIDTLKRLTPTLTKEKIHFALFCHEDLQRFVPVRETVEATGLSYIDGIFNLFKTHKIKKVSSELFTERKIDVFLPEILETHRTSRWDWMNLIKTSFDEIYQYIDDMKKMTSPIPLDPIEMCKSILPNDFEAHLKGQVPTIDSREINLNLVREKMRGSLNAYKDFLLAFQPIKCFGAFEVNFTKYFDNIKQKTDEFYNLVFKYMNAQTDKQVDTIGGMISSLILKATAAPKTVEEWYDKHVILAHIMIHINDIQATLDYLLVMLDFMGEFLFEPRQSFGATYKIKSDLHKIILSIEELNKKDQEEKAKFIEQHKKDIEKIQEDLKIFQEEMLLYVTKDVNVDSSKTHLSLLEDKQRLNNFISTCSLYQSRDQKLDMQQTDYPILSNIKSDFDMLLPAWSIAVEIDTTAQDWFGTIFKQLDVQMISDTVVEWENTLKKLMEDIEAAKNQDRHKKFLREGVHPLEAPYKELQARVQYILMHIPIIRYICNPNYRQRHWKQISETAGFQIGPNDDYTWNWLIEFGVEQHIIAIASISKAATNEAKIEIAIAQMCDDLQKLRFKVTKTEHGIHLDDPATALLLLAKHQQIMQEIFVPPYIQPFISKVKEYELLAANTRQILKQSIETEERINELQPAMESTDLKTQHSKMTNFFEDKVKDFSNFATNFKLSATFHMILSNQSTADECNSIAQDLVKVRDQLQDVLEMKRKAFPRFRLLSDSQLIQVISNGETPSKIPTIFSLMYPSIASAVFESNTYCLGFNSQGGEYFEFIQKVRITPECIEGWFIAFDQQITNTLKTLGRKIIQSPISNIEKMALTYPSQLLTLVFNLNFTTNVNKCISEFEGKFTENAASKLKAQLQLVYDSICNDLKVLMSAYRKSYQVQISNMIIVCMNHKSVLEELLKKETITPLDPIWLATPKYTVVDMNDFSVNVTVGNATVPYGFEYAGSNLPVIMTDGMRKFFVQMMACIVNGSFPLIAGWAADKKLEYLNNFLNAIGRQPFIYPCHYHTTIARMQEFIQKASECNAFVAFKDIYSLQPDVLSDCCIELLNLKEKMPTHIFATYTLGSDQTCHIPEILKLTFRPVDVPSSETFERFQVLLASMGIKSDELASKLSEIANTSIMAFKEPLCSALSYVSLAYFIQMAPVFSNDPVTEIFTRIVSNLADLFGADDAKEVIDYISSVFGKTADVTTEDQVIQMHKDPEFNDKLNQLNEALKKHSGVIINGPYMCGKSALIHEYCQYKCINPTFVLPYSFDLHDLYGDKSSGALSMMLQTKDTIVFDGPADAVWMDTLTVGLSNARRLYFGDGSICNLRPETRFIFETSDISKASPAALASCAVVYVGDNFLTLQKRIDNFLDKLENDKNIVEPLSHTILSSTIPISKLISVCNEYINYFLSQIDVHYPSLTSFFKCFRSILLNYYLQPMGSKVKRTAEKLLEHVPKFILFTMFWSFAGRVDGDARVKLDQKLTNAAMKKDINLSGMNISQVFFEYNTDKWMPWSDIGKTDVIGDPMKLIDREPKHLLFDPAVMMPLAFLSHEMLSRGQHVIVTTPPGIDQSAIANIIQHMPIIMDRFSPQAYAFKSTDNHKTLRRMMASILPDSKSSQKEAKSLALRIPLLSILGFDCSERNTAAEIVRYVVTHRGIPSEIGAHNEPTCGLTFCLFSDEKALQSPLANHTFSLAVPGMSKIAEIHAVYQAVKVLWNIDRPEISGFLLDLLEGVRQTFKFSMSHLFIVLQRVGKIMVNHDADKLCDVLAHQAVRVFYDSMHSEAILASISIAMRNISNALNMELSTNVFDIAGNSILTDLNSENYREVSCFADLTRKKEKTRARRGSRRQSLLRFTADVEAPRQTDLSSLKGINSFLRLDIISVAQALTIPKNHLEIFTSQTTLGKSLVKEACQIGDVNFVEKELFIPLMKIFHDTLLEAGKTKKHQVLFIDANTITDEEQIMLNVLMKTFNVFGLFSRGELLNLMTDIYSKKGLYNDPFNDNSLETLKNYNEIIADFMTDCEMNFHFAIVHLRPLRSISSDDEVVSYASIYTPFYSHNDFIDGHIEAVMNNLVPFQYETSVKQYMISDTFKALSNSPIIQRYPYLISVQNLSHIVTAFVEYQNKRYPKIKQRVDSYEQLKTLSEQIAEYIRGEIHAMEDMEAQLVSLTHEFEESEKQLEEMQKVTDEEMANTDRETSILRQEEIKADQMRRELAQELQKTNQILDVATQEIKNIKASDIAVIKNMPNPPVGVVLVVPALTTLLGVDTTGTNMNTEEGRNKLWSIGRKIMGEASFKNKLTGSVNESISVQTVNKLRTIVSDPNFQPSVIERSSSAAKAIALFIRAIIPYAEAIWNHKERVKAMQVVEENLEQLRKKSEEAVDKLNQCKKKTLELTENKEKLVKQRETIESKIQKQRNNIEDYKSVEEIVKDYVTKCNEEYERLVLEAQRTEKLSFLQMVFMNVAGPYNDKERDEIYEAIKFEGYTRKDCLTNDEPLVEKWNRTNMPVSWHWRENTSMLSPDNGRWVVAENAYMLSTSYLKKVVCRQSVQFLSAKSKTFDDEFVNSISSQVGIVLYDFDFNNPNLVVPVICRARETGSSIVYNNETIKVPKEFFVLFAVDELPKLESLGMDVLLIKFDINNEVNTEQIALKAFELTNTNNYQESIVIDNKIITTQQSILDKRNELKDLLINTGSGIFKNRQVQTDMEVFLREIGDLEVQLTAFHEKFNSLWADYPNIFNLSKEVVDIFEKYPVPSSLWKMIEGAFSALNGIRKDDFVKTVSEVITPVLAAVLPPSSPLQIDNQQLQQVDQIYKMSGAPRPIIIRATDTIFAISSLLSYLQGRKLTVIPPSKILKYVVSGMQTGTICATVCTSTESLHDILGPISKNLGANFVSNEFRLFIYVLGEGLELHSRLFTKTDQIFYKHPANATQICSETCRKLKKDLVLTGIPKLDSEISERNTKLFNARAHVFENCNISLTMARLMTRNKDQIFDFIKTYMYSNGVMTDEKLERLKIVDDSPSAVDFSKIKCQNYMSEEKVKKVIQLKKDGNKMVLFLDINRRDPSSVPITGIDLVGNFNNDSLVKSCGFEIVKMSQDLVPIRLLKDGRLLARVYVKKSDEVRYALVN
ncbi:hypothetical protein TVAG_365430 [Trichomonas vaginalis G3]|uniref:Dynein heavy chain family protein n=1 Tax=Trichomonas vaginalis (strain ATCC PRA-98 / G3) TaxID=412133 RepID=A2DHI7_TRIV3|nr:dynein heavy chain family protein family [Trichomonas vaginalis G3]EAY20035.1 hypothetical protein TVAG_365430 [Trichomonas vaginalis G3]KAI5527974.1 dynein heavy chain family protein family [Trichomonas vaginalis G3]|eukprot:XP_001581021.1 hypothetical protein [Trichomonas vaginalis G3]